MATEILLPKLGMNMESATIARWLKDEGDSVTVGDVLAEVETDKVNMELEAEASGVLRKLLVEEGERVAVNQTIAVVGSADEDITALIERATAPPTEAEASHVERVYESWRGPAPAEPKEEQATDMQPLPAPVPARPRREGRPDRLDPEAIRERLAQRGAVPQSDSRRAPRTRLVIYGAGLGAKQLLEVTWHLDTVEVVGLIDDSPKMAGVELGGVKVLGGFEALKDMVARGAVDGVALSFHSEVRQKVHRKIKAEIGVRVIPLVDPRAMVGMEVQIGDGALIEAGAVVGPGTIVGEGAIVDVGAVVAHDCNLGAFSHLSPGCTLSGVVLLTENVLVGVGAAINSTVTVGRNVIIAPGAAVMTNVPDDVVVSGVPAKVIGESRRGAASH